MQAGGFQIKSPTVVVVSVNPAAQITAEQICGGHGTAHQTAPDIHTLYILHGVAACSSIESVDSQFPTPQRSILRHPC